VGFPGLTGIDEARWKEDEARWEGSGPAVDSVPGSLTPVPHTSHQATIKPAATGGGRSGGRDPF
jgi:hypothetical protein